ncbi:MAG TPA: TlpA disulfide reductase family protein [Kribbellaceae bacterium]|nr:TlpA disulfide reductase family protein [Kribbellaceae bacterium]
MPIRRTAAVVAALVLLAGCGSAEQATRERKGQTGFVAGGGTLTEFAKGDRKPAPAVTGQTLDGATWSLADQRGKVVVLNVWGSWCAPCRKEAPDLVAAAEQLGAGAVFAGLNTRDLDKAPARKFVQEFKVPYPSIYDPDGKQLLGFRGQVSAQAIPSTLVIDAEGNVAARVIGVVTTKTLVDLVHDVSG